MNYFLTIVWIVTLMLGCSEKDDTVPQPQQTDDDSNTVLGCTSATYPNWQTSEYVLPYPVGTSYTTKLSHCSHSYHAAGEADEFATDFVMPVGTLITASRAGEVVHVEEGGVDGEFPNNLVVVKHEDNTYAQYMHLTWGGAFVEVGAMVVQGDSIGKSGATGLAGYPHLHFVVTKEGWEYPYQSTPFNVKNTLSNPRGPASYKEYPAFPY